MLKILSAAILVGVLVFALQPFLADLGMDKCGRATADYVDLETAGKYPESQVAMAKAKTLCNKAR